MSERVIIDRRFRGSPESGHGGYVGGVLAGLVGASAEITMRHPPPLETPLAVERLAQGRVTLRAGSTLVAEGVPANIDVEVPKLVSFREAQEAAKSFPGFQVHPFPMCFACGPDRAEGDGLRIFAGPVEGRDVVAAAWRPDASLTDATGTVRPEFIWAALDCPGGWALLMHEFGAKAPVLGRLAANLMVPVREGDECVIVAWRLGSERRKLHCGTALFTHGTDPCAVAKATWVLPA